MSLESTAERAARDEDHEGCAKPEVERPSSAELVDADVLARTLPEHRHRCKPDDDQAEGDERASIARIHAWSMWPRLGQRSGMNLL